MFVEQYLSALVHITVSGDFLVSDFSNIRKVVLHELLKWLLFAFT